MDDGAWTGSPMTLAEFQPHVERALLVVERSTAAARRLMALEDERDSILAAIQWVKETEICTHCGEQHCTHIENIREQLEPMRERLTQIAHEITLDVTEDMVSELPLRSVPIDLITAEVARRLVRMPPEFPVLRLKSLPDDETIEAEVLRLSRRWRTSKGQTATVEPPHVNQYV